MSFKIQDYNYHLPADLIATEPIKPKTAAKMLCISEFINHSPIFNDKQVKDLPECLDAGTVLVFNNTKVLPARLFGLRQTGAKHQILLLKEQQAGWWTALVHNSRKLKLQEKILLEGSNPPITAEVIQKNAGGICELSFTPKQAVFDYIQQSGLAPLPPYLLKRRQKPKPRLEDLQDYQTIFAKHYGAIAAPTAGLHFTQELFAALAQRGVVTTELTLHVGYETFRKVQVDDIRNHTMHFEHFSISQDTASTINQARLAGQKIIAVGTTVARALEAAGQQGVVQSGHSKTNLLIDHRHSFQVIQGLLTNFHLPQSTLLVLVAALVGRENLLAAYAHAIQQKYRFYSYGDCMLIT